MQLDLFLDSHEVVLINEAVVALLERDRLRAAAKIDELERERPDHPAVPALKVLATALTGWNPATPEASAITRRVAWLHQEVIPAAAVVLRGSAPAFVHPFFRELADAARGLSYDSRYPDAHRARLCLLAGDDSGAEAAALTIPNWIAHRDALYWLTVARYRRNGLDAARGTLFQLAWGAPAALPTLLTQLDDALLLREWHAFESASVWDSTPDDALASWFPAWYLIEHPGAAREFRELAPPDSPSGHAVRSLLQLLELEKHADVRALSAQRTRLRELNPDLFALYMARRTVHHP